jgi:hypothetical protein
MTLVHTSRAVLHHLDYNVGIIQLAASAKHKMKNCKKSLLLLCDTVYTLVHICMPKSQPIRIAENAYVQVQRSISRVERNLIYFKFKCPHRI